ncbi:MAG: diacylglyceryl transferase [Phycisphaera sp.]|nr:diacylglyceryl transferase [Phycisphaera sp.]
MTFPHYIEVFGRQVHPHLVMELIAYPAGFHLWLALRRRYRRRVGNVVPLEANMWIIVACIFGAAFGAKLLAWVEDWPTYWAHRDDVRAWIGGKTIVGGLLGGWVGVEVAKRFQNVRYATGDLYVFPLIVGMAIGRVGCFLTGIADKTYGNPTALPFGVDFGDGVPRHPTQLYEIVFLLTLGVVLILVRKHLGPPGCMFRAFIAGYLAWRFGVEFIKPVYTPYLGLSALQLASLTGVLVSARGIAKLRRAGLPETPTPNPEPRAPKHA